MQTKEVAELYQAHYLSLVRFMRRRVDNRETAKELAQETFARAYRARRQYDEARGPKTAWLWQIARNVVADYFRHAPMSGNCDVEPDDLAAVGLDVVSELDQRQAVGRALRALTPLQRQVVWLNILRGHKYEDIAATLGVTPGAVKHLAARARQAMVKDHKRQRKKERRGDKLPAL